MRFAALLLCLVAGCGNYLAVELGGVISEEVVARWRYADLTPSELACTPIPNRCGPAGLGLAIPDCPLGIPCFSAPCNNHDVCYGTCGTTRTTCDNEFFKDLESICFMSLLNDNQQFVNCISLAYVYWQAVARFGTEAFDDAQGQVCACNGANSKPIFQTDDRADAIRSGAPFDDADDDLLPDVWETSVGLDPTDPTDALKDFDSDGLVNLGEFIRETDPYDPDTDGNGTADGADPL